MIAKLLICVLLIATPATKPTTKPLHRTIHSLKELTDEMPEALLKASAVKVNEWMNARMPLEYEGEVFFNRAKAAKDSFGNDVIECVVTAQGYKSRGMIISQIAITVQFAPDDRVKISKMRPGKPDKFRINGIAEFIKFSEPKDQTPYVFSRYAAIVIHDAAILSK